jgi:hypothetical protein
VTYETLWVRSFGVTIACELPVALALLRGSGTSVGRRVAAVAVANLASHPIVWFVLARALSSRSALVVVGESWAVACEAAIYGLVLPHISARRALGVSAIANATSFAVGAAWLHGG